MPEGRHARHVMRLRRRGQRATPQGRRRRRRPRVTGPRLRRAAHARPPRHLTEFLAPRTLRGVRMPRLQRRAGQDTPRCGAAGPLLGRHVPAWVHPQPAPLREVAAPTREAVARHLLRPARHRAEVRIRRVRRGEHGRVGRAARETRRRLHVLLFGIARTVLGPAEPHGCFRGRAQPRGALLRGSARPLRVPEHRRCHTLALLVWTRLCGELLVVARPAGLRLRPRLARDCGEGRAVPSVGLPRRTPFSAMPRGAFTSGRGSVVGWSSGRRPARAVQAGGGFASSSIGRLRQGRPRPRPLPSFLRRLHASTRYRRSSPNGHAEMKQLRPAGVARLCVLLHQHHLGILPRSFDLGRDHVLHLLDHHVR